MSRDRLLPNIRGGCSKLLAAFSVARISLGLLDRLESSPWLGPRYGENLSLPFCPRLLSQEYFLDLSKFSLRSLGVPLVATSLALIQTQNLLSIVSVSGNEGPDSFAFSLLDIVNR
ncbi:hypothetical protein Tco_0626326 [Tanacetum coccineum]|uniref:Uncharacterized protein n=1 Tax=Tanacetum coccineum TaxID=301880 RepID=A0ABQ4WJE2_9ASTR